MRIATFNLENLAEGPELDARLALLRPQLLRLNADILCLQEVDAARRKKGERRTLSALQRLLEHTPYQDFFLVSTTDPGTGAPVDRHNLVVLSRWPVRNTTQVRNNLVAPPTLSLIHI